MNCLLHERNTHHGFRKALRSEGKFSGILDPTKLPCSIKDFGLTKISKQGNPRTTAIQVVAKENNLELDLVETDSAKAASTDYLKLNKQGLIPTFEGTDGYVLTECIAIAIYGKRSQVYRNNPRSRRSQDSAKDETLSNQLSLTEQTLLIVFTL